MQAEQFGWFTKVISSVIKRQFIDKSFYRNNKS